MYKLAKKKHERIIAHVNMLDAIAPPDAGKTYIVTAIAGVGERIFFPAEKHVCYYLQEVLDAKLYLLRSVT